MSDNDAPDERRTEGVRIIGAQEAAEAAGRPDVVRRRRRSEKRYGDRPDEPEPASDLPKITISTTEGEGGDRYGEDRYAGQVIQPESGDQEPSWSDTGGGAYDDSERAGFGHARIVGAEQPASGSDDDSSWSTPGRSELPNGTTRTSRRHGAGRTTPPTNRSVPGQRPTPRRTSRLLLRAPSVPPTTCPVSGRPSSMTGPMTRRSTMTRSSCRTGPSRRRGRCRRWWSGRAHPNRSRWRLRQPAAVARRGGAHLGDRLRRPGRRRPRAGCARQRRRRGRLLLRRAVRDDRFIDEFADEGVDDGEGADQIELDEEVVAQRRPARRRPREDEQPPSGGGERPLGVAVAVGVGLVALGLVCFRLGALPTTILATVVVTMAGVRVLHRRARAREQPRHAAGHRQRSPV